MDRVSQPVPPFANEILALKSFVVWSRVPWLAGLAGSARLAGLGITPHRFSTIRIKLLLVIANLGFGSQHLFRNCWLDICPENIAAGAPDAKKAKTEPSGPAGVAMPGFRLLSTKPMAECGGQRPDFEQIKDLVCKYPVSRPFVAHRPLLEKKVTLSKNGQQLLLVNAEGQGKATVYKSGKVTVGGDYDKLDRTVERLRDWTVNR